MSNDTFLWQEKLKLNKVIWVITKQNPLKHKPYLSIDIRIKLSKELIKKNTGKTLYILDEPTIGLHYEDIDKLMGVIYKLRESGSTVVIIEHNLEIINASDYIIDLGPDGGSAGGFLTFQGLKKDFVLSKNSQTSKFLNTHINELKG